MKPRERKERQKEMFRSKVESQPGKNQLSQCRSAFYFSKIRDAHNTVIKHLPHALTDLVCEYSLNLNTCSVAIIKKLAHSRDQNDSLVIDAQARLSCFYHNKGTQQNLHEYSKEAVKLLRLARKRQDLMAGKWALGLCHLWGIDVSRDQAMAIACFKKIADQGYAPAQYDLGCLYRTSRNSTKAAGLLSLAALRGHASAQIELGCCYELGKGVEKSMKEAVRLYRLAALQGHTLALIFLGSLYEGGAIGGVQNLKEAVRCYRLAFSYGSIVAKQNLEALEVSMAGIEQKSEAVQEKESSIHSLISAFLKQITAVFISRSKSIA